MLVLCAVFAMPLSFAAEGSKEISLDERYEKLSDKISRIEKQQEKILENQDRIFEEFRRLRVWVKQS